MIRWHLGVATAVTVLLLSPFSAQARQADVRTAPNGSAESDVGAAQPGDVVRLKIWREPDMSGDFVVDARGVATLPRLGAIQVTTMSADSLQRYLVGEYARYLKNPSVEVALHRRVRVVGAVRSPGLYTADHTMRIRDVLALAGGASTDGRTDRVQVDRDGKTMTLNLKASPQANDFALRSGDQLLVPEKSWFSRNTPLVAAIVSVSGGLLIAVAAR